AEIHAPPSEHIGRDLLLLTASVTYEQRLDPDLQFVEVNRFDQTIVCAGFENSDWLSDLIAPCKHYERRLVLALEQLGANLPGIDSVFGVVNNNEVEVIGKTGIGNKLEL